jgi:hypothetical protein
LSDSKSLPIAVAAALALGFAATIVSLQGDPGFGAVRLGPWSAWPHLGASDIDPYARAAMAIDGALPLGAGEGMAFVATDDQNGAPLDSRCDYLIAGTAPPARFWTLTAYDVDGRLRPNAADRYGLTSASLLRAADGVFAISAAREARPGNWLPLGEKSRFTLVLRAYQFSSGAIAGAFEGLTMPTITRGACS